MISLLLSLFLLVSALAQRPTPNGAIITLTVHVKITKPVVGLTWNSSTHAQEGVFAVSATYQETLPAGYVAHYAWTGDGLAFDDPTAASTTARSGGTGILYPYCDVYATKPGSMLRYEGDDASECAAVGGPIATSVAAPSGFYAHDANDPKKSWYLTFYNYLPNVAPPSGAQPLQGATLKMGSQPTISRNGVLKGTSMTWTLPGSTYTADSKTTQFDPNGGISTQPLSLYVSATDNFDDGTPKVHFHFDDGIISGDADDDSADYQVSQGTAPNITWVPLVHKVSGHKPDKLVDAGDPQEGTHVRAQPSPDTVYWTNKQ